MMAQTSRKGKALEISTFTLLHEGGRRRKIPSGYREKEKKHP